MKRWWGGGGISLTICKSFAPRSRQITMPAPHHSILYQPDALSDGQPTVSKHRRHVTTINDYFADGANDNHVTPGEYTVLKHSNIYIDSHHHCHGSWTWTDSWSYASTPGHQWVRRLRSQVQRLGCGHCHVNHYAEYHHPPGCCLQHQHQHRHITPHHNTCSKRT